MSVSTDANLGTAANGLDFQGGTLRVTGTAFQSTPRMITWGAAGGGFDIADAGNTYVAQALSGAGGLNKLGAGVLVLSSNNGYTGPTRVAGGTLQVGDGGTAGPSPATPTSRPAPRWPSSAATGWSTAARCPARANCASKARAPWC